MSELFLCPMHPGTWGRDESLGLCLVSVSRDLCCGLVAARDFLRSRAVASAPSGCMRIFDPLEAFAILVSDGGVA